jgi:hypothetical protein
MRLEEPINDSENKDKLYQIIHKEFPPIPKRRAYECACDIVDCEYWYYPYWDSDGGFYLMPLIGQTIWWREWDLWMVEEVKEAYKLDSSMTGEQVLEWCEETHPVNRAHYILFAGDIIAIGTEMEG